MPAYRDLKKILKSANGKFIRSGKGSNMVWMVSGKNIIIPKHKGKDIKTGTYLKLIKEIEDAKKGK